MQQLYLQLFHRLYFTSMLVYSTLLYTTVSPESTCIYFIGIRILKFLFEFRVFCLFISEFLLGMNDATQVQYQISAIIIAL